MMLAEISGWEITGIISSVLVGVGGIVLGIVVAAKKQAVQISPDPISVKLIERLVTKEDFNEAARHNESVHKEIFSKIGGVERGAAGTLDTKMTAIWNELGSQGKSIASLEKGTELQNQSLAAVQTDIKVILGRLPRSPHER